MKSKGLFFQAFDWLSSVQYECHGVICGSASGAYTLAIVQTVLKKHECVTREPALHHQNIKIFRVVHEYQRGLRNLEIVLWNMENQWRALWHG